MTQHDEFWFKFFPAEWFADEHLSMASASTRGIWFDILCRFRIAGRSSFDLPVRRWVRFGRADHWTQMIGAIQELAELGIADVWVSEDGDQIAFTVDSHAFVLDENTNVLILSRRLDRKYKKTEVARLTKRKQRAQKRVSTNCPSVCPTPVLDTRARARSDSSSSSNFDSALNDNETEGGPGGERKGGGGCQQDSAVTSAEQPTAGRPTAGKPTRKTHSTAATDPAEVDAVVARWLGLGKNPKDRTATLQRTRNSIARHLQDHPLAAILEAVDRVHEDQADLRYIFHIANAFGREDRIAPYYATGWTPASDEPTKAPKPERDYSSSSFRPFSAQTDEETGD